MSIFNSPGLYLRAPDGGTESIHLMKQAGFKWVALNMQDYDYNIEAWQSHIAKCMQHGVVALPWAYIWTAADCIKLRDVGLRIAKRQFLERPSAIWNAEKGLDPNGPGGATVRIEDIVEAARDFDAVLSTEPWAFQGVPYNKLGNIIVDVQIFPAEAPVAANDYRSCRSRFYNFGAKFVRRMLGIHDSRLTDFAPLESPYSVYSADDVSGENFGIWSPRPLQPLTLDKFPYPGALYGPSSSKTVYRGPVIKRIKRALHDAGFFDFPNPDTYYNRRLEEAMRRFQTYYGMKPTGQFGTESWNKMRTLPAANPGRTYAVTW